MFILFLALIFGVLRPPLRELEAWNDTTNGREECRESDERSTAASESQRWVKGLDGVLRVWRCGRVEIEKIARRDASWWID